ncbi:MAG: serine hydrolase [Myxococcales bacterium]
MASPATAVGARLDWVLSVLNGAATNEAEIKQQFDSAFLAQVSATDLLAVLSPLVARAPWKLLAVEDGMTNLSLSAVVRAADGEYFRFIIALDAAPPQRMSGLLLSPAGDLDPKLASDEAIDAQLGALAPRVNFLAASVGEDGCSALHALNPEANLALGSTFKLWILAALGQSIQTGERAWTDTIAIQDALKSLPSGTLQERPDGTKLSIRTFAEQMISISDNTAADHLLATLGRDSVEAMLAATRHHDPSVDIPFLSTREMFDLKLLLSQTERDAYVAASVKQKRALLAGYADSLDPRTATGVWSNPIDIDQIEWFATPADLCNLMMTLKAQADVPATSEILDVLTLNPGIVAAPGQFTRIGFKGGSEPGVLNLTWLLQRASDGAWRFLSLGFNDDAAPIDEERAGYLAAAARARLAQ